MEKLKVLIKDNLGTAIAIILAIVSVVYTYGHDQATSSDALAAIDTQLYDHDRRLGSVEQDNKQYGKDIAKMSAQIDDIWHITVTRDK